MKLDRQDLIWALRRMPKSLQTVMKEAEWSNSIFVGGGFLRSIISNDIVNDVDVFVKNAKDAELLAYKLCSDKKDVIKTDNAYTIKGKMVIQIIHRWVFEKPEDVSNSFDFTVCCAVIFFNGETFDSFCDERFYMDIAAKRIIYRKPICNEDAGGSMLRVLKYYQKGYCIPLDSLGAIIARLVSAVDFKKLDSKDEVAVAKIITGLLREVDPSIDPLHQSHLSSTSEIEL